MSKRIMIVLSEDPEGLGDEYAEWTQHHAQGALVVPTTRSAQAFRINPTFEQVVGDRPGTPRFRHLCIYEVEGEFTAPDPSWPRPDPPGGTGPNRPATFLFDATTELITRASDHTPGDGG